MNMEAKISLREWTKENKVWEPQTWRIFLEDYLVPFYKQAYDLSSLYKFLGSEKVCGKPSLSDIEDEMLRDKIRVTIHGGVGLDKDHNLSFAKFMYDNFGICAEDVPSFEESIEHYESWGDGIRVNISRNSWINSIPIEDLTNELRHLVHGFCGKLNIKLSEIGIQESYLNPPIDTIEPNTLLPQAGEKSEKLVSLINEFRQRAMDLSIGVNPLTTFVFYSRTIPLIMLEGFIECDMDQVINLANFLGLTAYSMVDQGSISLPTKSPDKVILLQRGTHSAYNDGLSTERIGGLQGYLEKIDPAIKIVRENMLKQTIDQTHITFEPWEDYEAIFSFLRDIPKEKYNFTLNLGVKNGKIIGLDIYPCYVTATNLPRKIWLADFLIKIFPVISAGMIIIDHYNRAAINELKFHPFAKEWIDKVIRNGGKI